MSIAHSMFGHQERDKQDCGRLPLSLWRAGGLVNIWRGHANLTGVWITVDL